MDLYDWSIFIFAMMMVTGMLCGIVLGILADRFELRILAIALIAVVFLGGIVGSGVVDRAKQESKRLQAAALGQPTKQLDPGIYEVYGIRYAANGDVLVALAETNASRPSPKPPYAAWWLSRDRLVRLKASAIDPGWPPAFGTTMVTRVETCIQGECIMRYRFEPIVTILSGEHIGASVHRSFLSPNR